MSVEAFRLQNFMPFEDTGWIELKPICLLFGRNSSGKSAIIRALRFLKQSLEEKSSETPFVFVAEYGVDLDSFGNVLYSGARDPTLSFSFRCTLENNIDILLSRINETRISSGLPPLATNQLSNSVEIKLSYIADEEDKANPYIWLQRVEVKSQFTHNLEDGSVLIFEAFYDPNLASHEWEEWQFVSDVFMGYDEVETAFTGASIKTTLGFLPELVTSDFYPDTESKSYRDLRILHSIFSGINQSIEDFLRSIVHLGPARPKPQRIYAFDPIMRSHWDNAGLRATIKLLEEDIDHKLIGLMIEWLKKFDLGINFKVKSASLESGVLSKIILQVSQQVKVDLVDTGYGVSQILPIIMECILAQQYKRDTLIIIEQPELHLHPKAQANIADLLIATVSQSGQSMANHSITNGSLPTEPRSEVPRIIFLIETHSEHILLRLRHSIVHTTLTRKRKEMGKTRRLSDESVPFFGLDQLRIYFVEFLNSRGSVESVVVDRLGQYKEQPKGFKRFFSNDYEQIMKITKDISELAAMEN